MIERVRITPSLDPLLYWAKERESIRIKRANGDPAPWTDDPILATYRFCNIRRRDDRVSRWLLDHVLLPKYIDWPGLEPFLMFVALCRWINWPPTIKAIMDAGYWPAANPNWKEIGKLIDARYRSGEKTWTGAYMIRAKNLKEAAGMGKGGFVAEEVILQSMWMAMSDIGKELRLSLEDRSVFRVWLALNCQMHWGPFMAGQVVADFSYIPGLLDKAADLLLWAPQGPGSVRGFNRLMGRPLSQTVSLEEWRGLLPVIRSALVEHLGPGYEDLTAHDVQNAMCEVDKWLRVKNGEGTPRSLYRPETAF